MISYLAFMGILLATGIDIALPAFDAIEEGFDRTGNTSLVITLYIIGMALGQLVYGPLADRFGRQPAILGGLALYALGAVLSALAPSFGFLLVSRLLWGLGAAAPAGLRTAIARDLYSGDAMARVTTIMMAVFLLGPIFIPLLGDLMISVAPWQSIFWFAAVLAIAGAFWTIRFGETLPEESRRSLDYSSLVIALNQIGRTRVTLGHMIANVFFSGAFFIFLGSSQPVFDQVFDRSSQFARLFALIGALTIPPLLLNNTLIGRFGARRMSILAGSASVSLSVGAALGILVLDVQLTFWVWFGWLALTSSMITVASPALSALALEPMGELAGTASSLLYFSGFAFGAGLAAVFDAQIDNTVTPMVLGFAIYTSLGLISMWWAGTARLPIGHQS